MNISKKKWLTLSSCMVSLAALMLQACSEAKETDCDKLCGNWVSVGRKPDVLIYREGDAYKVTVFKRGGLSRRLKPETYLLRSVYNQSVNYVNKHRHACSYRSYYQERIESIGYAYYDPDRNPVIEKLYSQDLRTSINEAIAALPAKCREVFSLSYLQGFSHREISEQMGIAQSTVENHIYLALRQLRAKLSKSELILLLFFIFLQNNSHPLG